MRLCVFESIWECLNVQWSHQKCMCVRVCVCVIEFARLWNGSTWQTQWHLFLWIMLTKELFFLNKIILPFTGKESERTGGEEKEKEHAKRTNSYFFGSICHCVCTLRIHTNGWHNVIEKKWTKKKTQETQIAYRWNETITDYRI